METNKANVLSQLMYEEDDEGNPIKTNPLMTEAEANALIEKHKDVFEHCRMMRSFAYYTANEIRKAEDAQ